MTFIPVNFDDAREPQPAPGGRYNLQIVSAEVATTGPQSKHPGSPQYKVQIGFQDVDNVPNITHFISLPHSEDEDGGRFKTLLLKRFLTLFRVPYQNDGFDLEGLAMEMAGAQANAEVRLDPPDDKGNVYNRLVVPRMPAEPNRR